MMQSKAAASFAEGPPAWRWHLLLTKPLGELIAVANLERQGYRVYYPRVKLRLLRRREWREAISSLFPRYLFVQLDASVQSLAPIRSTLGVASVVRFGQEYAVVPDGIVADLRARADPQSGLHRLRGSAFNHGSAVRIVRGPLAGLEGIFETDDARDRVVILLSLLGRESRVRVAATSIIPG
jgi:transcriptional antiterminator RfaH